MGSATTPLKERISESRLDALAEDFVKGFVDGCRLKEQPRDGSGELYRPGEIYLHGADSGVLNYLSEKMKVKLSDRQIKGLRIIIDGEPKTWSYTIDVAPFLNGSNSAAA